MGSPKLLFALLVGSIVLSAALKCHDFHNRRHEIVEADNNYVCVRLITHCAHYSNNFHVTLDEKPVCSAEDVTAGRTVKHLMAQKRSDYKANTEQLSCSPDPLTRYRSQRLFNFGSCDTDRCNDLQRSMTPSTCDKPVDPKYATFYCNVGTWADGASITSMTTGIDILYPLEGDVCYAMSYTNERTGKDMWKAGVTNPTGKKLRKLVCNEVQGVTVWSVTTCKSSGCNDGTATTGDQLECPNLPQEPGFSSAAEASTGSDVDGRGLLQLLDRSVARTTDDARRVLRVLQASASPIIEASIKYLHPREALQQTTTTTTMAERTTTTGWYNGRWY